MVKQIMGINTSPRYLKLFIGLHDETKQQRLNPEGTNVNLAIKFKPLKGTDFTSMNERVYQPWMVPDLQSNGINRKFHHIIQKFLKSELTFIEESQEND